MAIEWPLVLFTALTGCGGWIAVCIAVDEIGGRAKCANLLAAIVGLAFLFAGGIASVFHLSHPTRILNALGHPTSGIFIEAVLVGLCLASLLVFAIVVKREASAGVRKAVALIAGILGIVLAFMAGHSYMMAAIPSWNTLLLPIGYLLSAAPAGVAAYLSVAAVKQDSSAVISYAPGLMAAGVFAAIASAAYGVAYGSADFALVLWIGCAIVGGIASAALGYLVKTKPEQATAIMAAATICAIVGAIAFRCVMWLAGDKSTDFFAVF